MQRLWHVVLGLAVVPFIIAAAPASAEDYPSKPITIIVPFAAGGSSDIFARKIGEMLQESWGKPVIVESRAGGNAVIGSDYVARSAPDGHTILLVTDALTINAALQKSLPYDTATAFAPITMMASTPLVLVAHPSLGVKNVAELVALAKVKPATITFGSSGAGGPAHLSVELLSLRAGIKMVHVPYKGAGPALIDLVGGHISLLFNALPPTQEHIEAGKLVALGMGSPQRSAALPNLPTVAEQGFPGFEGRSWFGLAVPGKTPPEVVSKLSSEVVRLLDKPEMIAWMKEQGFDKVANSPDEFKAVITRQMETWSSVIKQLGIEQQ